MQPQDFNWLPKFWIQKQKNVGMNQDILVRNGHCLEVRKKKRGNASSSLNLKPEYDKENSDAPISAYTTAHTQSLLLILQFALTASKMPWKTIAAKEVYQLYILHQLEYYNNIIRQA